MCAHMHKYICVQHLHMCIVYCMCIIYAHMYVHNAFTFVPYYMSLWYTNWLN